VSRPLRAVLYARCSSLKQADRDLSVPAQLDACRLHAQRQGWLVTAEYHDDGISGFEDERRPAFRRMLADMVGQPRPFDVIVVWDFSRFSRSLEHSLKTMQDLRAVGVSLESTKEQTDDTPAGWLMGTIFRSFNEYQVRKLAEDTRRGMRKNAAEGGWNGGAVPVGYQVERAGIPPRTCAGAGVRGCVRKQRHLSHRDLSHRDLVPVAQSAPEPAGPGTSGSVRA
jgi:site-specific DNA recombinase